MVDEKYKYKDYEKICLENGISKACFYQRLYRSGWDIETTISTPVRHKKSKNDLHSKTDKKKEGCNQSSVQNSIFQPSSHYPAQEYRKWLNTELTKLQSMVRIYIDSPGTFSMQNRVNQFQNQIKELDRETYHYAAMDLYVTDPKAAEEKLSKECRNVIKHEFLLAAENKESLRHAIYYQFANRFNLPIIHPSP